MSLEKLIAECLEAIADESRALDLDLLRDVLQTAAGEISRLHSEISEKESLRQEEPQNLQEELNTLMEYLREEVRGRLLFLDSSDNEEAELEAADCPDDLMALHARVSREFDGRLEALVDSAPAELPQNVTLFT